MTLQNHIALVTGSSSGIGRGVAIAMAAAGADLVINCPGASERQAAEQVAEEVRACGRRALVACADVSDAAQVEAMVAAALGEYGRIDILVNNAAGNFPAPMTQISPNGFRTVVAIDLLGTYNVSRAVFDAWQREHGGQVVNISAPFELKGVALQAHVAAAKAGVESLTRSCAVEWGPYGIRVNAVAPGSIGNTEGLQRFSAAVTPDATRYANPLGLQGTARDVAHAVLFF